jgi:hypothetical protein
MNRIKVYNWAQKKECQKILDRLYFDKQFLLSDKVIDVVPDIYFYVEYFHKNGLDVMVCNKKDSEGPYKLIAVSLNGFKQRG